MNKKGFESFPNYISKIHESVYKEMDSYFQILDAISRVTNQSIFLVDFYRGEVLYLSYNSISLCDLKPEEVKLLGTEFNKMFVSEADNEMIIEVVRAWFVFLEQRPIEDRKSYSLQFDYYVKNKLIQVCLTPVFLCKEGKPWMLMCNTSVSVNSKTGNVKIIMNNTLKSWNYSFLSKKWRENKLCELNEIEQQVIRLSIQGKKENEICELIYRSKDGLKTIKRKMFRKMSVHNITEAASFAITYGLI